ncbi:hypothetical protein GCM10023231_18410 [Olivibacter ginsenosidimutans]|uniref:HTH cro/C1-type domain-containing protein n=1 Tax=Olivibacter ginsenosidimutans TaxID=1176537 RepID=A0ABP9B8Z3_9SPHI
MKKERQSQLIARVAKNLSKLKSNTHISYEKMHLATDISVTHIRNVLNGEANITLTHLEDLANLFGVEAYSLLLDIPKFPKRESLKENITNYLSSKGYNSTYNFKKLGPSYIVSDYIENMETFPKPIEASQIKDLVNDEKGTNYKTNDVSRILNKLVDEGILKLIPTNNKRKPKYLKS